MNENRLNYLYIYYLPIHAVVDGCSVDVCVVMVFSQQPCWALSCIYAQCIDLIGRGEMHLRLWDQAHLERFPVWSYHCVPAAGMVRERNPS